MFQQIEVDTERFILTTKNKMTIIIPPLYTLINEDEGVMDIQVMKRGNRITLTATLNNKPVEFDANMEIIIEGLRRNAMITRVNGSDDSAPFEFTTDGLRHFIQTPTSGAFLIKYN